MVFLICLSTLYSAFSLSRLPILRQSILRLYIVYKTSAENGCRIVFSVDILNANLWWSISSVTLNDTHRDFSVSFETTSQAYMWRVAWLTHFELGFSQGGHTPYTLSVRITLRLQHENGSLMTHYVQIPCLRQECTDYPAHQWTWDFFDTSP